MAFIDMGAAAGGKDLPFICGNVKVAFVTQTDPAAAGGQIAPKGINRVIGIVCSLKNSLGANMPGYIATALPEAGTPEDQVSIKGDSVGISNFLVFGY